MYDSGSKFELTNQNKLLNRYTLKDDIIKSLCNKIFELLMQIKFWIPEKNILKEENNLYKTLDQIGNL